MKQDTALYCREPAEAATARTLRAAMVHTPVMEGENSTSAQNSGSKAGITSC